MRRKSLESTQASHPLCPTPIQQSKVILSHAQLYSIPLTYAFHNIQYLFLSHNHLKSLKGLENYSRLLSLNISYNELSEWGQFVDMVPKCMRKICIRMNQYGFGIEDYVIDTLPSLERLDDEVLGTQLEKQSRWKIKSYIQTSIISAFLNSKKALQVMTHQHLQLSANDHPSLNLHPQDIAKLSSFFNPISPSTKKVTLMQISQSIIQIFTSIHNHQSQNYLHQAQMVFHQLLDQILVRLAERNNKWLIQKINQLIKQKQLQPIYQKATNDMRMVLAFGHLGGLRYRLENNPGLYIQKVDINALKAHPINQFVTQNKQNKQTTKSTKSLLGQGNKWAQLIQSADRHTNILSGTYQQCSQDHYSWIFQSFPIFIYQQNYLEIITHLLIQQAKKIVHLYDQNQQLLRKKAQTHSQNKQKPQKINHNLQNTLKNQTKDILFQPPSTQPNKIHNQTISQQVTQPKYQLTNPQRLYSLHQISLIYKSLRSLKIYSIKRKRIKGQSVRNDCMMEKQ